MKLVSLPNPFELTNNYEQNNFVFAFSGRFFKEKQYMKEEGAMQPEITFLYETVVFLGVN